MASMASLPDALFDKQGRRATASPINLEDSEAAAPVRMEPSATASSSKPWGAFKPTARASQEGSGRCGAHYISAFRPLIVVRHSRLPDGSSLVSINPRAINCSISGTE